MELLCQAGMQNDFHCAQQEIKLWGIKEMAFTPVILNFKPQLQFYFRP